MCSPSLQLRFPIIYDVILTTIHSVRIMPSRPIPCREIGKPGLQDDGIYGAIDHLINIVMLIQS